MTPRDYVRALRNAIRQYGLRGTTRIVFVTLTH